MASFLKRAFDLASAPSAGFVDVGGNTHEASIDALFAAGVTVGCVTSPMQYCPNRLVSRGEMATFLVSGFWSGGGRQGINHRPHFLYP